MGSWADELHSLKPTLLMVLVQSVFALVNVFYKLASNDGMALPILVAYRFMFGAAFIAPIAFFVERKKRPKLTWKIASYGFLCGLFGGSLGQNLYLKSLVLTSATFASAIMNLIPAITFVISLCLRLERIGWNTAAGKAKVFGTIIGIGGAMLLTFYKGPNLNICKTNINLLDMTSTHKNSSQLVSNHQGGHSFVLGALLALASCVSYSLWLTVQAKAAELYPCPYSITAMMTTSASVQGVIFALCTERDWSSWILGWNIKLITVIIAGIFGSGVMFTLVAWCVRMRGPLFVSTFNPLMLVMVAIAGSLFMNEKLHLGFVLGAVLIVVGLYMVLWGKGKELKKVSQLMPADVENPSRLGTPRLQSRNGSSRSGQSNKEIEEEREEEERRDSQASSEVLSGIYLYH